MLQQDLQQALEHGRHYLPQGRVAGHRIGLTLYKIDAVMDGSLDELIDALATADQAEKLKNAQ